MDPKTVDYLRKAAIHALQSSEDSAAMELITMMTGSNVQLPPVPQQKSLPSASELREGPAHDYHYWMRFIREQFIPFMTANGRLRFTSHELLTWLENRKDLALTTGDIEDIKDGRPSWRQGVTVALSNLKQQGIVTAPAFGKEYQIIRAIPPAVRRPALSTLRRVEVSAGG